MSLFAGGADRENGSTAHLATEDIAELESLFKMATPPAPKSKGKKKGRDGSGGGRSGDTSTSKTSKKKKKIELVEFRRANNVSIGLAQFKSFGKGVQSSLLHHIISHHTTLPPLLSSSSHPSSMCNFYM